MPDVDIMSWYSCVDCIMEIIREGGSAIAIKMYGSGIGNNFHY